MRYLLADESYDAKRPFKTMRSPIRLATLKLQAISVVPSARRPPTGPRMVKATTNLCACTRYSDPSHKPFTSAPYRVIPETYRGAT